MSMDPVAMLTGGIASSSGGIQPPNMMNMMGIPTMPGMNMQGGTQQGSGTGSMGGFGGMGDLFGGMGKTIGGTPTPGVVTPVAQQLPQSTPYKPGTYNYGSALGATAQQSTPSVNAFANPFQTPQRQVPQGMATPALNNLAQQHNSNFR